MKMTMTSPRALVCAPLAAHTSLFDQFRGATPFGAGVEGTSVTRVRTASSVLVRKSAIDKTIDPAMGAAARGRPL